MHNSYIILYSKESIINKYGLIRTSIAFIIEMWYYIKVWHFQ